jgi:hypothetical protein
MFFRIILCLAVAALTSCSTAKMAMLPGLEVNSVKYKITELPSTFSGGDLVFGPYRATKISRSGITSTGSGWTIGSTKIGSEKTGQDYTYQFKGDSSWNGDCKVKKGSSEFGIVEYGFSADLSCTFIPVGSGSSSASEWQFSFKGDRADRATGSINIGSKTIKVKAIDKMEGSPLRLGQNTGYYFYLDKTIIAAVDVISKEGPVWLNNSLSQDERDMIGMVAVALLLNQTY